MKTFKFCVEMKQKTGWVCQVVIKTFGGIYTEILWLNGFVSNIPHLTSDLQIYPLHILRQGQNKYYTERSFLERLKWYDASDEWMLIYSNEQQHRKFTFSCLPETPTLTAFTRKYLGHRKIFHFWEFLLDYDEEPFSLHTLVNPISWQNWINQ